MSNLFNNALCLDTCNPIQIVNVNMALNSIDTLKIFDNCNNPYDLTNTTVSYSLDSICWSCFMSYDAFLTNTAELDSDFYVRFKINGIVGGVTDEDEPVDYSTSLDSGFNFSYCSTNTSSNLYSPYSNMDSAITLQQQMVENVACMFGIPIYYFKLEPEANSVDVTFKEYTLMNVKDVKQIKLVITDNQMPSSKPEFNDWGLDWQTDWETEISKGMFATAFGPTAQPMEGDLIYIPMMKRMWMVNEAYEEKKDAFMWNSTTFKVTLVKYQQKDSVDLGFSEATIESLVKNKYEDLFGNNESLDSNQASLDSPKYNPNNLYSVAESDAFRKYISTDTISFLNGLLYFKGTMIADNKYLFSSLRETNIVYQKQFCGNDGTVSFIMKPMNAIYSGKLMDISGITLSINQTSTSTTIKVDNLNSCELELQNNETYFVYLRWSRQMNTVEFSASRYVHAENIPLYKLQNHHWWFDIDNAQTKVSKYDIELVQDNKGEIILHKFNGEITNIKVFEMYVDNVSEILQMYPNNQHLLVNDTARRLIANDGFINK